MEEKQNKNLFCINRNSLILRLMRQKYLRMKIQKMKNQNCRLYVTNDQKDRKKNHLKRLQIIEMNI